MSPAPDDPVESSARPAPPASVPVETPWGPAQLVRELAPGIVRYDTASHGGYWVSPERVATMPEPLREFRPFAGPNWDEEDLDWSLVAVAFPPFFPPAAVTAAHDTLRNHKPELYQALVEHRTAGRGA